MKTYTGINELTKIIGENLGTSDWTTITQDAITRFADATGDHQWIHIDSARAATELPGGKTIAHGFFTLSLVPMLGAKTYELDGFKTKLNYGLNKVRFIQPVPCDSDICAIFKLAKVDQRDDGSVLITTQITIAIKGVEQPACVAEMLALLIP